MGKLKLKRERKQKTNEITSKCKIDKNFQCIYQENILILLFLIIYYSRITVRDILYPLNITLDNNNNEAAEVINDVIVYQNYFFDSFDFLMGIAYLFFVYKAVTSLKISKNKD